MCASWEETLMNGRGGLSNGARKLYKVDWSLLYSLLYILCLALSTMAQWWSIERQVTKTESFHFTLILSLILCMKMWLIQTYATQAKLNFGMSCLRQLKNGHMMVANDGNGATIVARHVPLAGPLRVSLTETLGHVGQVHVPSLYRAQKFDLENLIRKISRKYNKYKSTTWHL